MKVKAVKVDEWGTISQGNVYEVISSESDGHESLYNIVNDKNETRLYYTWRFEIVEEHKETPVSIDAHYNFNYNLTKKEMDQGFIKVDPYFVAKQWELGEKDNSGIIFHCLKTLARYSEKNTKEREINALYKQVKRLAELEGVELK